MPPTSPDLLLINPISSASPFHAMPPLGLNFVGNFLELHGYSVAILDLDTEEGDFDLAGYLDRGRPKLVGIGGTTHSRFASFKIAAAVKEIGPEIPVVYGGCHASFTQRDTLANIPEIDYIVAGEGEETILELADYLLKDEGDPALIAGLSFRAGGEVVINRARPRIKDLDKIPYFRHLLRMERYRNTLDFLGSPSTSVITARGCPINCSFCSASAMFGKTYTMRSAGNVLDEIDYCRREFKIEGIKFFDSTLTLNRNHIRALLDEMERRGFNLPWECEIRADTVDRDLLARMKRCGCYLASVGLESASDRILRGIGKKISVSQVEEVIKWCKELEIKLKVFFTFGHIGETVEDSKETLKFYDKHFNNIAIKATSRNLRIYPGTKLEKFALENKLLPENFSWAGPSDFVEDEIITSAGLPVLMQPNYGYAEMKKVFYLKKMIDIRKGLQPVNLPKTLRELSSMRNLLKSIRNVSRAVWFGPKAIRGKE